MPFSSLDIDNPLMTDQSTVSGLSGLSSPFSSASPSAAPDQGLETLFGSTYSPASAAQTAPQSTPASANLPDISGNVKEPSFWERVFPGALGGPAGVQFQYQKLINERVRPVVSTIMQEFSKALNTGNYDRANEAILGMSQVAGKAPQFGKMLDSMTGELNKRRTNAEGNASILDFAKSAFKDNPDALYKLGSLEAGNSLRPPEQTVKLVEKLMPQIKMENGWTAVADPFSGTTNVKTGPVMLNENSFTPEERIQMRLANIDPTRLVQTRNKLAAGKGDMEDFQNLQQMQSLLQQRLGVAEANKFIPFSERAKTGMEPAEALQQTGVPQVPSGMQPSAGAGPAGIQQSGLSPVQQQTAQTAGKISQLFQFTPQEAVAWHGILAQESSLGQQNVGDNGKSIGPGHVQQAALTDFNQKHGTNVSMDQLKQNPELAMAVSAGYFKQQLQKNAGNIPQSLQDYNGGGDKNYVSNVQKRIAELTGQGQTGIQKLIQQQTQIQAAQHGAQVAAGEQAKKTEEPTNQASTYWEINAKGMPVERQGERLTVNQAQEKGLYKAQDATEEKYLRDFRGKFEQGQRAFELIKQMPEDVLSSSSSLKKIFNYVAATGVSIPLKLGGIGGSVTIPGLGAVTLTQKEASAYNLLVGTAQNVVEPFLNRGNTDNTSVSAVKSAVYGAFANKDSALTTIKSALEQGWTETVGRMKSAQGSGAETAQMPKLEFSPSSQGGAAETLSGQNAKPLSQDMSPGNIAQQLLKDLNDLPKNIVYLAEHPETKKLLKDVITALPKAIAGKAQDILNSYLEWNRQGEQKIKAEKEMQQKLKDIRARSSQGPISQPALSGIGSP